jgi:ATP-dependent DNA helicase MPH1
MWRSRRVFFATPQTVQSDINRGACDPASIVCVVVDEAHKATGNYSYVKVIEEIALKSSRFRVLALSATPGSDIVRVAA